MTRCVASRRSPGFTLVEVLVVITIVGVLLSLLFAGIYGAVKSSRHHALVNEIGQVSLGLEQFHERYGCYPPDMHTKHGLRDFVRIALPRANYAVIETMIGKAHGNPEVNHIDPPEALVLFLKFMNTDPRTPLRFASQMRLDPQAWKNPPDDLAVFFEFPKGSLQDMDQDGFPEFTQKYAKGAPLVYFDSRSYDSGIDANFPTYPLAEHITNKATMEGWLNNPENTPGEGDPRGAKHYRFGAAPGTSYEATRFQLICAGEDGKFGSDLGFVRVLKDDQGQARPLRDGEADNLTNFTNRKTLSVFLFD